MVAKLQQHYSQWPKCGSKPKCPLTDKWINKTWSTYNKILFSHRKEGHPVNATTQKALENIILSERTQTQKDK